MGEGDGHLLVLFAELDGVNLVCKNNQPRTRSDAVRGMARTDDRCCSPGSRSKPKLSRVTSRSPHSFTRSQQVRKKTRPQNGNGGHDCPGIQSTEKDPAPDGLAIFLQDAERSRTVRA